MLLEGLSDFRNFDDFTLVRDPNMCTEHVKN